MKIKVCRIGCLFTAMLMLASCSERDTDTTSVDISDELESTVTCNLEDIGAKVTFIPLEDSDSAIMSGYSVIKYANDNDILMESERELYRFDNAGALRNKIGSIGQGPGEYNAPGRVSYDVSTEKLYLYADKSLQQWTMDGDYLGTIQLSDRPTLQSVLCLSNDTVFIVRREYGENGTVSQRLQWCDLGGEIHKSVDFGSDSTKMDVVLHAYPEIYRQGDNVLLRYEWDNKIYKVNFSDIELCKEIDFGIHNPDRGIFHDATQMKNKGTRNASIDNCIVSGSGYIWLTYWLDNKGNRMLIDNNGNVMLHAVDEKDTPAGLEIGHDTPISIWPSYVDDSGVMYAILTPGDLDDDELNSLSRKLNRKITEDTNNIIVKIEL